VEKDIETGLIITVIHNLTSSEIALRQYCRGRGCETRSGLNFFQALISQLFSNSNWTEWSTIQGVNTHVLLKIGRFEITSSTTPYCITQGLISIWN